MSCPGPRKMLAPSSVTVKRVLSRASLSFVKIDAFVLRARCPERPRSLPCYFYVDITSHWHSEKQKSRYLRRVLLGKSRYHLSKFLLRTFARAFGVNCGRILFLTSKKLHWKNVSRETPQSCDVKPSWVTPSASVILRRAVPWKRAAWAPNRYKPAWCSDGRMRSYALTKVCLQSLF